MGGMVGGDATKVKAAGRRHRPEGIAMHLDIFSDTICPWCFVGKRRLERALQVRPQPDLTIRWRAFQLNPAMPADGMERRAYLEAKFGGAERSRQIYDTVRSVGLGEGIAFNFDGIRRTPNTLQSHRLIRFAANADRQNTTLERLFSAYFIDGRNIGDRETLADIGASAGLDRADLAEFLAGDIELETVLAEDTLARRAGINGVPCFIFNGRFALSGAQEPEAFFQLFDLAREHTASAAEPALPA